MKFNFRLKDIEVMDVKIGEVEVSTELTMQEVIGLRIEGEILLRKLPQFLEQLATAQRTFDKLDREFESEFEAKRNSIVEEFLKSLNNR